MTIFNNIFIVGLGLVGGSFAKTLKKYNPQQRVGAFDTRQEYLDLALAQKDIDYSIDLSSKYDTNQSIDLIIICAPLSSYGVIFNQISGLISDETTIIDFGSVKSFPKPKNIKNFILCHPITGSHASGFENCTADIFDNTQMIICDNERDIKDNNILCLFQSLKISPIFMEVKRHDKIYALISHLPQFLSFLLYDITPDNLDQKNPFFKSFRLKDSDPKIWQDVFNLNEKNIENYYINFFDNLEKNVNSIANNVKIIEKIDLFYQKYQILIDDSKIDEEYLYNNFSIIMFHTLVVVSYLEIEDVASFSKFCGNGFKDFISIIKISQINKNKLSINIRDNEAKLRKMFNKIAT